MRDGLADVIASDAHGPTRPPRLTEALDVLAEAGMPRAETEPLVAAAPRALLAHGIAPLRRAPPDPRRDAGSRRVMPDDVTITPYRDGPLLVRGPFRLLDQDGNEIDAGRETVALCRCGKSRLRPFCDGTHRLVRFKAPSGARRPDAARPA